MATIEYTASPILPCGIPKLKRAKLEELAIDQMRQIIDLQNELMAVKNVAHRTAYKLAERDSLIASYQKSRADAVSCAASPAAERGEVRCDGRVGCTTSNGEKK